MKIIVYWPENIFSYNIIIVFSDLESELVMPDSQMTHSVDQIGQTSLQKGLKLFVIHFESFFYSNIFLFSIVESKTCKWQIWQSSSLLRAQLVNDSVLQV